MLARPSTAAVIGPGLGGDPAARDACLEIVKGIGCPLVIDADGLNALAAAGASCAVLARKAPTVLTPHPGELRRLLPSAPPDRPSQARRLADESGCIVVLKGHRTLVAEPGGRLSVCLQGSPALARGGTGDVLSGLLGSCLARGIEPFLAASAAVYLHGLAGELLARERGEHMVPASAIAAALPAAARLARERAGHSEDDRANASIGEL
ncbi:MAG: NAD(P)H-hydrate dehydratase [Acidobacteriota bacterium]